MRTLIGGSIDGTGRTHLVVEGIWRSACGSRLPERWLPEFGADVTCKRCRRTVAYTSLSELRPQDGPGERQADQAVQLKASGHVDLEDLARRARQVRRESRQRRAERRNISQRAQELLHGDLRGGAAAGES